ncbi:MAG: histidine phosphatase family protein [Actinomycetota bacterium]
MELILVRHARPEHIENADGPADPPLTEIGRRQALAVAGWLATEEIDALYASPMVRARETAAPLARVLDMEPEIRAGVREFDAEDRSYIPVEVLRQDREKFKAFVASEQVNAERLAFAAEVVETLTEIAAAHRSQRVVVVCHGGVINAWTTHVLGIPYRMFFDPTYTSINRYMIASSGEMSLVSLNERAHLRAAPGLQL